MLLRVPRRATPRLLQSAGPRPLATATAGPAARRDKESGNISSAFVSLSGTAPAALPDRFCELKCNLVRGKEREVVAGWSRLLRQLRRENEVIARKGSAVVPQVDLADVESGRAALDLGEVRKRGVLVVRGVIPEGEARAYKHEIEDYVRKNPHTKAFPPQDPQVYELYWSAPQLKARSHASLLRVQRLLMTSLWHSSCPTADISLTRPLTYADRLRIRQPGDSAFALGPHMDGGSVERWEPDGYGRGGTYAAVFAGQWEQYDPWDAAGRLAAVTNLYDGLGACSVFRMWQGWLSMSATGPREGTLLVHPLVHLATAYVLLRPFFRPRAEARPSRPGFLDDGNWLFAGMDGMTSDLHGASPGFGQELSDALHPHLELDRTMVHIPRIKPGDFVAWHCDTIHAVDKVHHGRSDSSVLYIPVCPTTALNAEYVARQREAFRRGVPAPDFPGGEGESRHVGRPTDEALRGWARGAGRQAFGLERLTLGEDALPGERRAVAKANAILGFGPQLTRFKG